MNGCATIPNVNNYEYQRVRSDFVEAGRLPPLGQDAVLTLVPLLIRNPKQPGRLDKIESFEGLLELESRSNPFISYLTELVRRVARLIDLHPLHRSVASDLRVIIPKYLEETEDLFRSGHSAKPVFFSPELRSIVVNVTDFAQNVQIIGEANPDPLKQNRALKMYVANRVEFALHEYGHVADANGLLVSTTESQSFLASIRSVLVSKYRGDEGALSLLDDAEYDLRAEAYRSLLSREGRSVDAYFRFLYAERIKSDGPLTVPLTDMRSVVSLAQWAPLVSLVGDRDLTRLVRRELALRVERELPPLVTHYEATVEYFTRYFASWRIQE